MDEKKNRRQIKRCRWMNVFLYFIMVILLILLNQCKYRKTYSEQGIKLSLTVFAPQR